MSPNKPISPQQPFRGILFLDLESTGVFGRQNSEEETGTVPRITEVGMISYQLEEYIDAIRDGREPRCGEKMLIQVNPELPRHEWSAKSSEISGITYEMVEKKETLRERWPEVISYLNKVPNKPACIIAHNGNYFDFRLLKIEIQRLGLQEFPEGIFLADSWEIIPQIEDQYREDTKKQLNRLQPIVPLPKKSGNETSIDDMDLIRAAEIVEQKGLEQSSSADLNSFRLNGGANEYTPARSSSKRPQCEQRITGFLNRSHGLAFDRSPIQLPAAWGGKFIHQIIRWSINGGEPVTTEVIPDPEIPADLMYCPPDCDRSDEVPSPSNPPVIKRRPEALNVTPRGIVFSSRNIDDGSNIPSTSRNEPGVKRKLNLDDATDTKQSDASVQSEDQKLTNERPSSPKIDKSDWSPAKRRRVQFERLPTGIWQVARKGKCGLKDLYHDIFGADPPSHHEADADCRALMQICVKYGNDFVRTTLEKAVRWEEFRC